MESIKLGTNYYAKLTDEVWVRFTDEEPGFVDSAKCNGNPNVVAMQSGIFLTGCFIRREDILTGQNIYTNQGTIDIPNWIIGAGGGGGSSSHINIPQLEYMIPSQQEPVINSAGDLNPNNPNNLVWNFKVYNLPTDDDTFLVYNPTIELMRFKRKNSNSHFGGSKRNSKNTFVHPVNNNGVADTGKPWNGGASYDNSRTLMPGRHTEWSYTSVLPFAKTDVTFDIGEWKGAGTNLVFTSGGVIPFPMSVLDYEGGTFNQTHSPGNGNSKLLKSLVFAFRLRIDNPIVADRATKPYVYGPISEHWKVLPKLGNGGALYGTQVFYGWKITRCQYAKNK